MIHENILYGYDYDTDNNILIGRKDISSYGFFSTFTLLITALMGVYNKYKQLPKIDGRNLLRHLCDDDRVDMYSYFFHIDESVEINFEGDMPVPTSNDDQHTLYKEENIKYYGAFFKRYFNLNKTVSDRIENFKTKYNIDSDKSISIIYRSTDKWTDMGGFNQIGPGLYYRLATKIKTENPDCRILIQAESDGIVKVFSQGLGAIKIEETLVSAYDDTPLFLSLNSNKLEWAENYIAALFLHSKSKYLVTYTGNSAFFIYMSRGTTKNMYQETTFTRNDKFEEFFVNNF
jgi:hypothetical protein